MLQISAHLQSNVYRPWALFRETDNGFSIQNSASLYCAEVKVPSFTKGKAQLSKHEADSTRELTHPCGMCDWAPEAEIHF